MTGDDGLPPLTSGTGSPSDPSADSLDGGFDSQIYDIATTSGIPPEDPCAIDYPVEPLDPWVMIVVDLSGSMVTQTVDHDADERTPPVTRWSAIHAALANELPQWDANFRLGLRTFPSLEAQAYPDLAACSGDGVVVNPATGNAMQVLDALPAADDMTLTGAAPLRAASYEAHALLSLAMYMPDTYMVVITDGAPNCTPGFSPPDTFELVDYNAMDWRPGTSSEPTRDYVIAFDVPDVELPGGDGEPMANPHQVLTSLLFSFETYTVEDTPGLESRLAQLRSQFASQRVPVPEELMAFSRFDVEIDGTIYFQVNECGQDGYVRVYGDTHDSLKMCGTALTDLWRTGSAIIRPYCGLPPPD